MSTIKETPLHAAHLAAGGKMVAFAGYDMPVQYPSGIIAEHMAVREQAGLFDVSHMGEFILSGPDALKSLNHLLTNDFSTMTDGRCRYSPMCQEDGGILDDLLVYRFNENRYMIIVNAANREQDYTWMQDHLIGDSHLEDKSDATGLLALQGPNAQSILEKIADPQALPDKFYTFKDEVLVDGKSCLVSRTGYTGEHGYEIYCQAQDAQALWDKLLAIGEDQGLIPCGLGARDTLRLEASMPLYGNEMSQEIDPFQAELSFFVKMDKEDFIGKDALQNKTQPSVHRVGLKMIGRGIARHDAPVFKDDKEVGYVTSGTHLPFLGGAYAMAMVDKTIGQVGDVVQVMLRNKPVDAEIVALPFYKRT